MLVNLNLSESDVARLENILQNCCKFFKCEYSDLDSLLTDVVKVFIEGFTIYG